MYACDSVQGTFMKMMTREVSTCAVRLGEQPTDNMCVFVAVGSMLLPRQNIRYECCCIHLIASIYTQCACLRQHQCFPISQHAATPAVVK